MNLHDYDITTMAKEVGIEEGARNKAIEAAENLLKLNKLSEEEIAQTIGLPIEQVLKLKKNNCPCSGVITLQKKRLPVWAALNHLLRYICSDNSEANSTSSCLW